MELALLQDHSGGHSQQEDKPSSTDKNPLKFPSMETEPLVEDTKGVRQPLLKFFRRRPHRGTELEASATVEYLFTGKMTLFPLTVVCLGLASGVLLLQGNKPYLHGYFGSNEMYFGLAGVILAIFAVALFVALMLVIVLKISFTFTTDLLVIKKHGVFRSSKLEFVLGRTTLHYFRTHFSESQAWLQLVVKEDNLYHQIFSWKGEGNQKDRFFKLFATLQKDLAKWQSYAPIQPKEDFTYTEIVTQKELNLISPFTQRLQVLSSTQKTNTFFQSQAALCIEGIPVVNYDKFFSHFRSNRTVNFTNSYSLHH